LATPIAYDGFKYGTAVVPEGNPHGYTPASGYPTETLGFKDLDLQVTKDFSIYKSVSAYVRIDFLNVFNWTNYDFASEQGNFSVNPAVTYDKGGPIDGTPRELKLTAGMKF
jgi:hypothetical protein